MHHRYLTPLVLGALILGGLTACGDDDAESGEERTLTVYAAASLKTTFEQIGEEFEAQHEGVTVEFSFAGSSDLAAQIQQGAPADVFASADTATMDKLTAEDLVEDPTDFAGNTLTIAVPPGNPADIATLADLAREGVDLVVCAAEVPCGAAAAGVEEVAGLDFSPVSEEQSVTDVLNKVIVGEADAGLVYVTDVAAAGDKVEGIDFPEASAAVNTYPIATVNGSDESDLAGQFVDLVLAETGQQVLADAGFAPPAAGSR